MVATAELLRQKEYLRENVLSFEMSDSQFSETDNKWKSLKSGEIVIGK